MNANTILIVLLCLSGCTRNSSQTNPLTDQASRRARAMDSTPEDRATLQTRQMKQTLGLSADQEITVAAINLKYAQQMQPLIDNGQRSRETMQRLRQLDEAKNQELRRVLTAQQLETYEAQQDERRSRIREQRGGRMRPN
jgi:hypothetical protein